VIRGNDLYGINVIARQQIPVVAERGTGAALSAVVRLDNRLRALDAMGVNIADRNDLHLLEAKRLAQIAHPHTAHTDAADGDSFTGSIGAEDRRRNNRWKRKPDTHNRRSLQDIATGQHFSPA
jgi:hypothetical protein